MKERKELKKRYGEIGNEYGEPVNTKVYVAKEADAVLDAYEERIKELEAFKAEVETADEQYKEERLSNVIGWLNSHKDLMFEQPERSLVDGCYIYPLLEKAKQELAKEKYRRRHLPPHDEEAK